MNSRKKRPATAWHQIETAVGNQVAARAAWAKAQTAYLAYRQQGGYAQTPGGKLVDQVLASVQQGKSDEAIQVLIRVSQEKESPDWLTIFAPKTLAILKGARDTGLADDPAFDYAAAADILFLIERVGKSGIGNQGSGIRDQKE